MEMAILKVMVFCSVLGALVYWEMKRAAWRMALQIAAEEKAKLQEEHEADCEEQFDLIEDIRSDIDERIARMEQKLANAREGSIA